MSQKRRSQEDVLLRWTKRVATASIQDPLGLGLRVSGRFSEQLLHCITSITPRARYYSFLPWCVSEYWERERGTDLDKGLVESVTLREKALVFGCVAHHYGEACEGGALVPAQARFLRPARDRPRIGAEIACMLFP